MFWHRDGNPGTLYLHKLIKTTYDQGKIPFGVRVKLFPWIEYRFLRGSPQDPECCDVDRMVKEFFTELQNTVELLKLDIHSIPTNVDVTTTLETTMQQLGGLSAHAVHAQLLLSLAAEAQLVHEEFKMRQDAQAGIFDGMFNWQLRLLTSRCMEYRLGRQWDPHIVTILLNDIERHLISSNAIVDWKWSEKLPRDDSSLKHFHNNYNNFLEEFLALQNAGLLGPSVIYKYHSIRSTLMGNALIVDVQPPDVVTTTVQFSVSVRWRWPPGGAYYRPQNLKISLINGDGADQLVGNGQKKPKQLSTISHKTPVMEDGQTKINDIKLTKVIRAKKGLDELVTSELFALHFRCKILSPDNSTLCTVWCCSRPFLVVVHSVQRKEAEATLVWYKAFQDETGHTSVPVPTTPTVKNGGKFTYPQKMSWDRMSRALSENFRKSLNSNWQLTPYNLNYLKSKLCDDNDGVDISFKNWTKGHIILSPNEAKTKPETKTKKKVIFKKKSKPAKVMVPKIIFWTWWSATIKLIEDHLFDLWNDGLILGFVNREEAFRILEGEAEGTFLFRFSETFLGGVSIFIVGEDPRNGTKKVEPRKPFTDTFLSQLPLVQHILLEPEYHAVYSKNLSDQGFVKSKAVGFNRFVTSDSSQSSKKEDPYVQPQVRVIFKSNLWFTPGSSTVPSPCSSSSCSTNSVPPPSPRAPPAPPATLSHCLMESSQEVKICNNFVNSLSPETSRASLGLEDMEITDIFQ